MMKWFVFLENRSAIPEVAADIYSAASVGKTIRTNKRQHLKPNEVKKYICSAMNDSKCNVYLRIKVSDRQGPNSERHECEELFEPNGSIGVDRLPE